MSKGWIVVTALVSSGALSGAVAASGGGTARLGTRAGGPTARALVPRTLPPLPKGAGRATRKAGAVQAVSVLDYDDNTCESGLGANGNQVSALVEFDPTPPCTNAGALQILAVTARMNTGNAQDFVYHVPGAAPQPVNNASVTQPLSPGPITPSGACPATGGLQARVLATPVSVTPGNAANFFAGIRHTGFAGMDRTAPNANRHWMLCASCAQTQYSPAEINALLVGGVSLGGNRLIRVTVEDVGCTPVELQGFEIGD
jgi:hypothetical protein